MTKSLKQVDSTKLLKQIDEYREWLDSQIFDLETGFSAMAAHTVMSQGVSNQFSIEIQTLTKCRNKLNELIEDQE